MADYKVGEKVRLLHETGEAVVVRIISPKKLEVLLDDFLELEVHVDEVVKISRGEANLIKEGPFEEKKQVPQADLPPEMAIFRNAHNEYEIWMHNPRGEELVYALFLKVHNKQLGLNAGIVAPRDESMAARLEVSRMHQASQLWVQCIRFKEGDGAKPTEPFSRQISIKLEIVGQETQPIEGKEVEGLVFLLEEIKIEPSLGEPLTISRSTSLSPEDFKKPPRIVDLHLEKLVENATGWHPNAILQIQLEHFEKSLTDAILHKELVHEIIYIHGVGNGRLQREIHVRLKAEPFVKKFQKADPLRFGNGATIVEL